MKFEPSILESIKDYINRLNRGDYEGSSSEIREDVYLDYLSKADKIKNEASKKRYKLMIIGAYTAKYGTPESREAYIKIIQSRKPDSKKKPVERRSNRSAVKANLGKYYR
ncbi:MAG: hypothetical protein V1824_02655 [archaeon]